MITSRSNPVIKQCRKTASKLPDASQKVVIEGIRLVREAVNAGASFEALFFTPAISAKPEVKHLIQNAKAKIAEAVSEEVMKLLTLEETAPGIWGLIEVPSPPAVELSERLLVLIGVQDPGNAGTLIRSAEGAGAAVWFSEDCVHLHHPKVVKASMGSIFRVPAKQGPAIPFLRQCEQDGRTLIGTKAHGGILYSACDWKLPFAILLGGEARGLPPEIERFTKLQVSIPLQGSMESLNVAVAGSILLFESHRGQSIPSLR